MQQDVSCFLWSAFFCESETLNKNDILSNKMSKIPKYSYLFTNCNWYLLNKQRNSPTSLEVMKKYEQYQL